MSLMTVTWAKIRVTACFLLTEPLPIRLEEKCLGVVDWSKKAPREMTSRISQIDRSELTGMGA